GSWADFLARIPPSRLRQMCHARTKKANNPRYLQSPTGESVPCGPALRLRAADVWEVMVATRGRCVYCGSLCVETAPYDGPKKLRWEHVGRRIGSLEHLQPRVFGGGNEKSNLAWACLWCNIHECERRRGATDHGGLQVAEAYDLPEQ